MYLHEKTIIGKKTPNSEPTADRYKHVVIASVAGDDNLTAYEGETIASGLTAVWSKDNTREDLFDAMERKETYVTTGTRISVRLFGGWDYNDSDVVQNNMAEIGYSKGVPMGGDLPIKPNKKNAPTFMVSAMKDPHSGNLDRIQIIKGWTDKNNKRHEIIYDVAVSDGREIDTEGRCKTSVGDTVDVKNATYTNSIEDVHLQTVWSDPDFNDE